MITDLPKIVLNSPDMTLASVPYLLGFQPVDSLVFLWLLDNTILVTMRVDNDVIKTSPDEIPVPRFDVEPDELISIGYNVDAKELVEFTEKLVSRFDDRVNVRDIVTVSDNRWRSALCTDLDCCPATGHAIKPELAADFIAEGVAPLENREDLRKECLPAGEEPSDVTLGRFQDPELIEYLDWFDELRQGKDVDQASLVDAGILLRDIRLRDHLVIDMTVVPSTEMQPWYDMYATIARAMHVNDAAPACTMAAVAAYMMGDGARALVAIDQALESDEDYSFAQLLHTGVTSGLPPEQFRAVMASARDAVVVRK